MTVNAGTVVLNKATDVQAIGGNLTVAGGAVTYTSGRNNQIADTATEMSPLAF